MNILLTTCIPSLQLRSPTPLKCTCLMTLGTYLAGMTGLLVAVEITGDGVDHNGVTGNETNTGILTQVNCNM